jgi:biopolymer transport protein ExbD
MAQNPQEGEKNLDRQSLTYFYGTLGKTILALWQSITGGADWDQMARPMIHEVSPLLGLAFCLYIAFAILALMNVVTGVFVQTALQSAQKEEDSFLTDQIVSLFQMAKGDKSAKITLDEIQQKVNDPAAAKEWKSINVSADEATYLFDLLDIDQSGDVYFEEFLSACIRLRGPAKSIDTLTMMQEARARYRTWQAAFDDMGTLMKAMLHQQDYLRQVVEHNASRDHDMEARMRYIEAIMLSQVSSGSTGSLPELPGVEGVLRGEEV